MVIKEMGFCLPYKGEKRGCLAASNQRLVLTSSHAQLAWLDAANVLLWGQGSLPQLLSGHVTTLIAITAKGPSINHQGCKDAMDN